MLVWMTGELDYVDILYPKKEKIHLLKDKDANNDPHYVGDSQKTEEDMQFSGKSKQCSGDIYKEIYCQAQVQSPEVQIPVKGLGVTIKSHGPPPHPTTLNHEGVL